MSYFHLRNFIGALTLGAVLNTQIATHVRAHGFEGDRFFPPTIQTDDPFATDELALPTVSVFNDPPAADGSSPKTREIDVNASFSKEIFPKFALSISDTYLNLEPQGHQGHAQSGFDNIELNLKYVLFENAPHEVIFSVGSDIDLGGTGSKPLGVESFTTYTPQLYFGKGFGDLPDALKYAKPLAVTGTLGYDIPTEAADPNAIEWGVAVEYSLPYLEEHVEDTGLPRPFRDLIPLVEFSMTSPTNRGGGTTTGTVNPGVLWEQPDYQVGVEAVIPANSHSGQNVGAIVQVQIYIDDLFPGIFGHPIFGRDADTENENGRNATGNK